MDEERKVGHNPDRWVVLRVKMEDDSKILKVFGTWSGSYLYGDSWRLNSGVEKVESVGDYWYVTSHSGALYKLHKECYGIAGASNYNVLASLEEKFSDILEVLTGTPEEWKE